MTVLSVTDASRMAGVSAHALQEKINSGEMSSLPEGINVAELIRVYPNLHPLANLKIREVKKTSDNAVSLDDTSMSSNKISEADITLDETQELKGTVELLVRELEWNKDLLEKTNQLMEKQLADQRAMIADQARRLDDKDRFWARQVEIAQSLLPAPAPIIEKRKKIFGLF